MAGEFDYLTETDPTSTDPVQGPSKPLDFQQRLILQNLFDTQPKRREAYLKRLGYEMNPQDENEYRPIGSPGNYAEIDPGISAYFKPGGLQEFALDVGDLGGDVASGAMATIGAAQGAASGAIPGAALGPAGAAGLGAIGFVLGGAGGNATAELVKKQLGDLVLDENVPLDMQAVALQSAISGVLPLATKGGRNVAKGAIDKAIKSRTQAIMNVARQTDGALTQDLLKAIDKNPDKFSKEAVEGASEKLTKTYQEIFGLNPTQIDRPDQVSGVFKGKLNELNKQADELIKNSKQTFTPEQLKAPLDKIIEKIQLNGFPTEEQAAATKYLKAQKDQIDAFAKKNGGLISFDQGRNLVKKIQDDGFNREVPGSGFLRSLSGGKPDGLLNNFYTLGGDDGKALQAINEQRSRLMSTYNDAQRSITPGNIINSFVGKDNVQKQVAENTFKQMDEVLGTQFTPLIESGQFQNVVENLYKTEAPKGSSNVIARAAKGTLKGVISGAGKGAGLGALTGVGVTPGAAIGAVAGGIQGARNATAYATGKEALEALLESKAREATIGGITNGVTATLGDKATAAAASQLGGALAPTSTDAQAAEPAAPMQTTAPDDNPFSYLED